MDNLDLYGKLKAVPDEAKKKITGGRLSGMSDINPMWRIKSLTENFGICGIGWKYVITKQWIEIGGKDEKAAFVNIDLFIKVNDTWSDAIPGTGGSSFVALEKNGLYTSDECFKMALTDAISVACKALGMGADVYFEKDRTKYTANEPQKEQKQPAPQAVPEKPTVKLTPKSEYYAKLVKWIADSEVDATILVAKIRESYVVDFDCEKALIEDAVQYRINSNK
jgi:hypothetical protein